MALRNITNMDSKVTDAQAAIMYCERHPAKEKDMYCKRCKIPTCTTCVRDDHSDHDFETIATWSKNLNTRRIDFHFELRTKFEQKRDPVVRKLYEVKSQNINMHSNNVESLEQTRKKLHDVLDQLINKELHECKTHSTKLAKGLDKVEEKHTRCHNQVQKMLDTFEKTTMTGLDIIEYYENLSSQVETMETDVDLGTYRDRLVYEYDQVDISALQEMIGKAKEVNKGPRPPKQLSAFVSNTKPAYTINPVTREDAWIAFGNERELTLINKDGKYACSVPKQTGNASFYVTEDKSFVVVETNRKAVMRIDKSGNTTIVLDTSPLKPAAVGWALTGNMLLALVDEPSASRDADSTRKVQLISPEGEVLHEYEFGEDGATPALSFPNRVTQNYNSNICIVNTYREADSNAYKSSICVFFEDGEFKFNYKGHETNFDPTDICCDSLCNILCLNKLQSDLSVHVIDRDGRFLKNLLSSNTCVPSPKSIALYDEVLWIGSLTGEIRVYRYKF